jgi:hypothetical protein
MNKMIKKNENRAAVLSSLAIVWRLLRCRYRWTTTGEIGQSLKQLLVLAKHWLLIRAAWIEYSREVSEEVREADSRFSVKSCCMSVGSGNGVKTKRAETLLSGVTLSREDFDNVVDLTRDQERIATDLDLAYSQTVELWNSVPEYLDIKKLLPIGGRQALSMMKVVIAGTESRTKPDQHEMFGFSDDFEAIAQRLVTAIKGVNARKVEKGGAAPSWKAGTEVQRDWPHPQYVLGDIAKRRRSFCRQVNRDGGIALGGREYLVPSLWAARKSSYPRAKQLVRAIMGKEGCQNSVVTVLLSRPESIGGNDYVARATWQAMPQRYSDQQYRRVERVEGWIYLRANWPDMIHSGVELSAAEATAKLDSASEYYFRNLERTRLARMSTRQRRAHVLRALRSLPMVSLQDSFKVGNCNVGTSDFTSRLGIQSDTIQGRELACLWVKANYIQEYRFVPVVEAAVKRTQATVDSFYKWAMGE